jgi:hypothetical protein
MLSARRRKKSKNSNYLLSLDQVDLSRKSPNCVGKVPHPHFTKRLFLFILLFCDIPSQGPRQHAWHCLQRVRAHQKPSHGVFL